MNSIRVFLAWSLTVALSFQGFALRPAQAQVWKVITQKTVCMGGASAGAAAGKETGPDPG